MFTLLLTRRLAKSENVPPTRFYTQNCLSRFKCAKCTVFLTSYQIQLFLEVIEARICYFDENMKLICHAQRKNSHSMSRIGNLMRQLKKSASQFLTIPKVPPTVRYRGTFFLPACSIQQARANSWARARAGDMQGAEQCYGSPQLLRINRSNSMRSA